MPEAPADIRLLGAVEVTGPAGRAELLGARQRALVALLALNPGTVVPRTRLVDAMWGEDPPRTAVKTLFSHVTRVRQALAGCGLAGSLVTREPGYLLALPASAVDAQRFEAHTERARQHLAAGSPDAALGELRTGLALWRGDALADAEPGGWALAEAERLHEGRLSAHELLADTQLQLGEHEAAIAGLDRLLVVHPLRERLAELLMLGLYRAGRHPAALDAYQRIRVRLAGELGCDPGPGLRRLHGEVLRRDPALDLPRPRAPKPVAARPAQLPPRVGHFTARDAELRTLAAALAGDDEPGILLVSGPAGMGKTALAVEWAHRERESFPDGQLYLDLRGHDPDAAMPPREALSRILRGIGVPADRVPADVAEQSGLYRSLLDGRRMLVVLDNGASADQVLPLVPASAGCRLLVTSRGSLGALAAHHAVRSIDLGLLDAGEAFELLCRVLGPDRVAAEPDAARRLGELCGRMPLALRIAAARLASQPRLTLAEFGDALASTGRLDALAAEGDSRSVRTVFASVYGGLAPEAARLFRLAGLHPGRTIGPDLAAALTGGFPTEAGRILAELAASHLLTRVSDGRYGFHDLIRLYAQERVRAEDGTQACADAEDRLLDWYLAIAAAAHSALGRDDGVDVHLTYPPAGLPFGSDAQDALDFLAAERDNLVPVGQFASAHGRVVHGWQLPHLLTGYYDFRGDCEDRVALARSGVDGARQSGDQRTEALLRKALGVAYINTRRFADALDELGRARALARAAGDRRGEANICNNVAVAHAEERRFAEAIAAFGEALAGYTETGHRTGMAMALSNIGEAQLSAGRPERSAAPLEEALRLARELENPWLEGRVLTTIGQAHARQGRPAEALAWLSESLEVRRRIGARRHELDTLNEIGSVRLAIGEPALAVRELHEALVIGREIGDPHVEAVTLHNLGRAYLACGDRALAREYASLAAETRARVPDAFESAAISETLRAI